MLILASTSNWIDRCQRPRKGEGRARGENLSVVEATLINHPGRPNSARMCRALAGDYYDMRHLFDLNTTLLMQASHLMVQQRLRNRV